MKCARHVAKQLVLNLDGVQVDTLRQGAFSDPETAYEWWKTRNGERAEAVKQGQRVSTKPVGHTAPVDLITFDAGLDQVNNPILPPTPTAPRPPVETSVSPHTIITITQTTGTNDLDIFRQSLVDLLQQRDELHKARSQCILLEEEYRKAEVDYALQGKENPELGEILQRMRGDYNAALVRIKAMKEKMVSDGKKLLRLAKG